MAVQHAAQREGWSAGAEVSDRVTPRQTFCGPLLSAMLFGGGSAGISDIYVHIRDIVSLSARDWESNPLERRLARWHTSLSDKGLAVAREFGLISRDGVLIDRALLRKQLVDLALEFEKMYRVVSRPGPTPPPAVALEK